MSKITQTWQDIKAKGQKALIVYLSCGDPSLEYTEKLAEKLSRAGVDFLELGIPYSDPVADGPIIQRASQRALAAGIKIEQIFQLAASLRNKIGTPLILMTYFNVIYRHGIEQFVFKASQAGVAGLIVPDLPLEEAGLLKKTMEQAGLDLIFLAAPTSTASRLQKIGSLASGFLYCVSVTGVTGSRKQLSPDLAAFIKRVGVYTDLPLAVGFGISGPDMARQAAQLADGVIVGSAVIEKIEAKEELDEIASYVASLKEALNKEAHNS